MKIPIDLNRTVHAKMTFGTLNSLYTENRCVHLSSIRSEFDTVLFSKMLLYEKLSLLNLMKVDECSICEIKRNSQRFDLQKY